MRRGQVIYGAQMNGIKKFFRALYIKLFLINDTPHKVAGGVAVGVFCGMAPGMGPIAAVALAFLLRTNRAAALLGSVATNTWISIVTFAAALKTGAILTGTDVSAAAHRWQALIADFHFTDLVKFSFYGLILPILVGYLAVSAALAVLAYISTFLIIKLAKFRKRHIIFAAIISTALFTITLAQGGEERVEKATFAAGCFWGVEDAFRKVDGVISVTSGYTGGSKKDPSYEEVCTGKTGHAEAVEIEYDAKKIAYERLLDLFWSIHDPTTPNRQGPDTGSQYRSAIFYHNKQQESSARASKERLEKSGIFKRKIVTEILPAGPFYRAEEYHQRYNERHGIASCHVVNPKAQDAGKVRIYDAKKKVVEDVERVIKTDEEWKKILTPEQFGITRKKGTELPFTGECGIGKAGLYKCVCCGTDLFDVKTKFESGTGWPSFWQPVSDLNVRLVEDKGLGMLRTEVLCARCDAHLGHVFEDGPPPTHKRYCINAAALKYAGE